MLRFPDDARLDRHIAARALPPAVLRRLGDRIHSFHASVEVSSSPGAALALLEVIEGNVSSMRKFPDILDRTLVCNLAARHRILCRSLAPLLEDFGTGCDRSEEHTSELQSLMRKSYAVF